MKNQHLIETRKQSGKTQAQVAKEIDSTEIAYQRYEYGMRETKVTTAIKVARALGVIDFNAFCDLWGMRKNLRPLDCNTGAK